MNWKAGIFSPRTCSLAVRPRTGVPYVFVRHGVVCRRGLVAERRMDGMMDVAMALLEMVEVVVDGGRLEE